MPKLDNISEQAGAAERCWKAFFFFASYLLVVTKLVLSSQIQSFQNCHAYKDRKFMHYFLWYQVTVKTS